MTTSGEMPYRTLGKTGERVSLIGIGGFHIGSQEDERESIAIIRTAIDNGINFLDNCWSYHAGVSERRMGRALKDGYRSRAFLMTKIDARARAVAESQIDDCLRRLDVETIDLLQIHEVLRMEDPDWVFAPDGAMAAVLAAKRAGKVRYVGFTGHKDPAVHLNMLRVAAEHGFAFDAVQMPLSLFDYNYADHSFERQVLPALVDGGIGVLAMKTLASGRIPNSGAASATECLHYAMSLPTSVVITGCDSLAVLQQAIDAARTFRPLGAAEMAALRAKAAGPGADGALEPFKTTTQHDGTTMYPEWMWGARA